MTATGGASLPSRPMSAERWARLAPLIDTALDLAPEPRRSYLASVAATDASLGAELARCIAASDDDDAILDRATAARTALLLDHDPGAEPEADLRGLLQQSFGSLYRMEYELSGAGMSRVFVAHEPALGRMVVIKVLSDALLKGAGLERFAEEIRLTAPLRQANITPLLAAGSAAGYPYYTMPFVEGQSLRDRIEREGALALRDAVSILRDVARALAYAHSHGVVHRDIKPGNVLLSGGTAVVTDFGIARAIGAALSGAAAAVSPCTGTPAYMAPEQAMGDAGADHRVDLYAFGCLAYAMLTGAPPFIGRTVQRTIEAHRHEPPVPLRASRPDVPEGIAEVIARCLEKDPVLRPRDANELLDALDPDRNHMTP